MVSAHIGQTTSGPLLGNALFPVWEVFASCPDSEDISTCTVLVVKMNAPGRFLRDSFWVGESVIMPHPEVC